jgi:membrane protein implicated in regulation of membrane protease activity
MRTRSVSLFKEVTTHWLLLIYVLTCLLGAHLSDYLGLAAQYSFVASLVFSLFETWVGYYAISQWVKIRSEMELR